MLIGALTTRAKAMSSQSKYQWNDQEREKIHRVFWYRERGKNAQSNFLRREFFLVLRELLFCCVTYIKHKTHTLQKSNK